MSFNLINNPPYSNQINVIDNYKKTSEEFCKHFYNGFDYSFPQLNTLFKFNASITFLNTEFIGFENLLHQIQINNLYSFEHHSITGNSQPVDRETILINTTGSLSINDSLFQTPFSETIVLKKDNNNCLFITNWIFRLLS